MAIGPYSAGQVGDYTQEINKIPNEFTAIQQAGLFGAEGVATTTVIIDQVEDDLVVLPEVVRGSPASRAKGETIKQLPLIIPHIPHEDYLMPEDIQDKRYPGQIGPDTLTRKRAKKMESLRRKHAQTLEWLRMGAIKGLIVGGSGNTIYNLYTEFGVSQETQDYALTTDATDVPGKIRATKRFIENNVFAGMMVSSFYCYCSPEFFDALVTHPNVVRAYQYYASRQEPLRNDTRRGFLYQGVMFEEYNANITLLDGTAKKFIDTGEAYMFAKDVPDLFMTYFAPANRLSYVNTEGQEIYLFEYPDPEDRFIKMYSESNPLPICRRPQSIVKLVKST